MGEILNESSKGRFHVRISLEVIVGIPENQDKGTKEVAFELFPKKKLVTSVFIV